MSKVNLHCDDDTPDQLHDWTTAISKRIGELNRSEVCILASFPGSSFRSLAVWKTRRWEGLGMRLVCTLTVVWKSEALR